MKIFFKVRIFFQGALAHATVTHKKDVLTFHFLKKNVLYTQIFFRKRNIQVNVSFLAICLATPLEICTFMHVRI